nr:hypothetical protein CFP56_72356 [Quercus suber]
MASQPLHSGYRDTLSCCCFWVSTRCGVHHLDGARLLESIWMRDEGPVQGWRRKHGGGDGGVRGDARNHYSSAASVFQNIRVQCVSVSVLLRTSRGCGGIALLAARTTRRMSLPNACRVRQSRCMHARLLDRMFVGGIPCPTCSYIQYADYVRHAATRS